MNDLHPNTVAATKQASIMKVECNMVTEKNRWNQHLQEKVDYAKKLKDEKSQIKLNKLRLESDERQDIHNHTLDAAVHAGTTAAVIAACM